MKKIDYHAKITIHGLPKMNRKTHDRMIKWLENMVRVFKKERKDLKIYAKTFTARLMK